MSIRHKNWTIEADGIEAEFRAVHDNYDPTPANPSDAPYDPDHIIYCDTPAGCIQLIDELDSAS